MEFNAYSMLVDFMWAGIFLFAAKMLREKIKILQSLFVPVSLLAGFIGLALGQNGFGIISFSSQFGSYAGLLIIAVFVSIGLRGFNFSAGGWKTNFDRIGSYYCFRNIGWAFQYAMPIIFAMDKCNGGYFNRYFWWNCFNQNRNEKKLYQVCKRFQPAS